MLIKDGFVSPDHHFDILMIALHDHGQAVEALTKSIRETKQMVSKMGDLYKLGESMKVAMDEFEENKKSTAAALKLMDNELQKLRGSTKVKPSNMALCFLLVALMVWFVMGQMNGEEKASYGLMLGG